MDLCAIELAQSLPRRGVALRCSEREQPPRLGQVDRPALTRSVHAGEHPLRIVVALRCSNPKQPPRLAKVLRPAEALQVHVAERTLCQVRVLALLRTHLALRCNETEQAPRLHKVHRPTLAIESRVRAVHTLYHVR
jgi:hypothetical protein